MAKWGEPSDETFKKVTDVLISTGLENLVDTKIILNDDQKKVIVVQKESAVNKFAYGYDLKLTINEIIFDGLTDIQQVQIIEEALAGTWYDFDNDKLVVNAPDKVYRSFIEKYGWDETEKLRESVKSLYDKEKNNGEDPNVDTE